MENNGEFLRRFMAMTLFVITMVMLICVVVKIWPISFVNTFAKDILVGRSETNFIVKFEVKDSTLFFPILGKSLLPVGWASWDTGAPFNYANSDFHNLIKENFENASVGTIIYGEKGLENSPLIRISPLKTLETSLENIAFNFRSFSVDPRYDFNLGFFEETSQRIGTFPEKLPYLFFLGCRAFGEGTFALSFTESTLKRVQLPSTGYSQIDSRVFRFLRSPLMISAMLYGVPHELIFDTGSCINVIRADSPLLAKGIQLVFHNPRDKSERRLALVSVDFVGTSNLFMFEVGGYLEQYLGDNELIFGLNAMSRWDWIFDLPSARVWRSDKMIKNPPLIEYNLLNRFLAAGPLAEKELGWPLPTGVIAAHQVVMSLSIHDGPNVFSESDIGSYLGERIGPDGVTKNWVWIEKGLITKPVSAIQEYYLSLLLLDNQKYLSTFTGELR